MNSFIRYILLSTIILFSVGSYAATTPTVSTNSPDMYTNGTIGQKGYKLPSMPDRVKSIISRNSTQSTYDKWGGDSSKLVKGLGRIADNVIKFNETIIVITWLIGFMGLIYGSYSLKTQSLTGNANKGYAKALITMFVSVIIMNSGSMLFSFSKMLLENVSCETTDFRSCGNIFMNEAKGELFDKLGQLIGTENPFLQGASLTITKTLIVIVQTCGFIMFSFYLVGLLKYGYADTVNKKGTGQVAVEIFASVILANISQFLIIGIEFGLLLK